MIRIAEQHYLSLRSNRGKKCLCACKCNIRYLLINFFSPTDHVPGLRAPYINYRALHDGGLHGVPDNVGRRGEVPRVRLSKGVRVVRFMYDAVVATVL